MVPHHPRWPVQSLLRPLHYPSPSLTPSNFSFNIPNSFSADAALDDPVDNSISQMLKAADEAAMEANRMVDLEAELEAEEE